MFAFFDILCYTAAKREQVFSFGIFSVLILLNYVNTEVLAKNLRYCYATVSILVLLYESGPLQHP